MKKPVIVIVAGLMILTAGALLFPKQKTISIGMNPWPGYEPIMLASTLGIYEKHNLKVEVKAYNSLNDTKSAFLRGQVDLMGCTLIEAIELRALHDIRSKIILVADYSDGADLILSKQAESISQLKGKKIGLEMGTISEYLLQRSLETAGMSRSEIEAVPMDQHQMLAALRDGRVDAVVTYPPESISIMDELQAKDLFNSSDIPFEVVDVIVAREEVIAENPELFMGILKSWQDVTKFIETNKEQAYSLMAERQGITPSQFEESLEGLQIVPFEKQMSLVEDKNSRLYQTVRTAIGVLKAKAPDKFQEDFAGDFFLP